MKNIIIATAGHIDHGKTTLIRALTGVDTDRWKEEKQRGITIDLGYADIRENDTRIHFIDVPGHEKFVRNMLAGAGTVSAVLFIIAADEGIKPQTVEHFDICRLLGFERGIIALTKTDLVDEEMLSARIEEISAFTEGSFLEKARIVNTGMNESSGIDELKSLLVNLVEEIPDVLPGETVRLPVDRSFSKKGFGTVITGSLLEGKISVDDQLEVLPGAARTKVRNIQVFSESSPQAVAGQRTALNLRNVERTEIKRGDVLTNPDSFECADTLEAKLHFLGDAKKLLGRDGRVKLYHLSREVRARVRLFTGVANVDNSYYARIKLEEPIFSFPGDRFILRRETPVITAGGGIILCNKARGRTPGLLEEYDRALQKDRSGLIRLLIDENGTNAISKAEIRKRTGLSIKDIKNEVENLRKNGDVITDSDGLVINSEALETVKVSVKEILTDFHMKAEHKMGLTSNEIKDSIKPAPATAVLQFALESLIKEKSISVNDTKYAMTEHARKLKAGKDDTQSKISEFITACGKPVALKEISENLKIEEKPLRDMLSLMVSEKEAYKLSSDMFISSDYYGDVKDYLRELKERGEDLTVAAVKERYSLSRKFAIPLLEFLDKDGLTYRLEDGSRRIL